MSWVKVRDYYEYDLSRDKSFFRVIAEQKPSNDLPPDEISVNISVKNVEKRFIYLK
jgi:hypothetical protein